MTTHEPVVTDWQKAIKAGDITVDIFQPDRIANETLCHVGYCEILPWSESLNDEMGGDYDPETHLHFRIMGGGPQDENFQRRNSVDAVLTPREAYRLAAAEWPTTLHDFLEVIRTANQ